MVMKFFLLCGVFFLLNGCVGQYGSVNSLCDPKITLIGPDTYLAEDTCGGVYELSSAHVFCKRMGMQVEATKRIGSNEATNLHSSTTIQCIAPKS